MKKAFTLIELSIVAIIASILIVGVAKGVILVKTARLTNARSLTSKSIVPEINGLVGWWEASLKDSFKESEASDSGQLTRWYDISPGSNLTNSENGKKNILTKIASANVTYEPNGINNTPSVNFKNSDKFSLSNFYQGSMSQAAIFVVFRPAASSLNDSYLTIYDNASTPRASINIKQSSIRLNAGSDSETTKTITSSDYVLAAYFNGPNSKIFLNSTAGTTLGPGSNSLIGATIGGTNFAGLISEVIVYNRILNVQERKDVMGYLSKKYKISVSEI